MSILKEMSITDDFYSKNRTVLVDIVYFEREGSNSTIGRYIGQYSKEVYNLNVNDLKKSRGIISNANVDVLLYLAIGTEKFSYLLAHSRFLNTNVY